MNPDPDIPDNPFFDACRVRLDHAGLENRTKSRVSVARLAMALVTLVVLAVSLELELFPPTWSLVPTAGFVGLVVWHRRLFRAAERNHRAARWLQRAAERVYRDTVGLKGVPQRPEVALRDGDAGSAPPSVAQGSRLAARRHRLRQLGDTRLAEQLDLFGPGQLFERLADWRTDSGGETLAAWMLHPASPEEAQSRQEAVAELAPKTNLREWLAARGGIRPWPTDRRSLIGRWIGMPTRYGNASDERDASGRNAAPDCSPPLTDAREDRLRALICASLTTALGLSLAYWLGGGMNVPFSLVAGLAVTFGVLHRGRVGQHERALDHVARELRAIRRLGRTFAREELRSPRLLRLKAELAEAVPALSRILRVASRLRFRRNLVFALFAMMLFWGAHHALAVNRWRRRHRKDLARWARAAGELDALMAMAQYQAERPGHVFARFDGEPGLEAVDLGHPLLPEARLQRNSIRLGRGGPDILLVTGSNMSGKSTLLRALGTNFVLARMGAPVTATSMTLGPLALGASLSVRDSLRDGVSRFLAELFALRAVLGSGSDEEQLLFLLDEVLEGTNSNDRRLAAGALLTELARRRAVGVLTTHDLSLTELDHEFPGRVRNMHLIERIEEGRMDFDYQLRDGVLPRGNALDLMRILGLPAPEDGAGEFTSLPVAAFGKEN